MENKQNYPMFMGIGVIVLLKKINKCILVKEATDLFFLFKNLFVQLLEMNTRLISITEDILVFVYCWLKDKQMMEMFVVDYFLQRAAT